MSKEIRDAKLCVGFQEEGVPHIKLLENLIMNRTACYTRMLSVY